MKGKIAGIVAAAVLALAIGSWLWIGRDSAVRSAPDSEQRVDSASQVTSGNAPEPNRGERAVVQSGKPGESAAANAQPQTSRAPFPNNNMGAQPQASQSNAPRMAGNIPTGRPAAAGPVAPATMPSESPAPEPVDPELLAKVANDVDQVGLMLRDFRTRMGENPFGTNAEIMQAVMGDNPKQARLGPPEGQSLNANGELIDRWGTPYFFHQLSKTNTEVRSAGPDRVMWTEDDIIRN